MILDPLQATVQQFLTDFDEQAKRLRQMHGPADVGAHTVEYMVSELRLRVKSATKADLTPEQFGALPDVDVSAQTVRRWCRAGLLAGAVHTSKGWRIPRASRVRKATA